MISKLRSHYLLICVFALGISPQQVLAKQSGKSLSRQFADLPPPPQLDSLDVPEDVDSEIRELPSNLSQSSSETAPVAAIIPVSIQPEPDATLSKAASHQENHPQRIYHEVIPYERLDEIANRYGVSKQSILLWNKKVLDVKNPRLRAGQKLRIYAVNPPPAKQEVIYEVRKGDTWSTISKKFNIHADRIKRWNHINSKTLRSGNKLKIWIEPPPPPKTPSQADLAAYNDMIVPSGESVSTALSSESQAVLTASLAAIHLRQNGYSVGKANRGKLTNGVQLPDNPQLYLRRKPDESWGSSHTIEQILRAIIAFHYQSGYTRPLTIGAISRKSGGRFPPHSSHQSGRDVDIRLPKKSSVAHKDPPKANEVDWRSTWRLVHSFISTNEVEYIFLDHRLQKQLHQAALADGMDKKELENLIQWPQSAKTNAGIVRHASGHTSHIHVRVKCSAQESRCESK